MIHCCCENRLVQALWKSILIFHKEIKIQLPYSPYTTLLGIYRKNQNQARCQWLIPLNHDIRSLRSEKSQIQASPGPNFCNTSCQWKKLGHDGTHCYPSDCEKYKIGALKSRLAWAKTGSYFQNNQRTWVKQDGTCLASMKLSSNSHFPSKKNQIKLTIEIAACRFTFIAALLPVCSHQKVNG